RSTRAQVMAERPPPWSDPRSVPELDGAPKKEQQPATDGSRHERRRREAGVNQQAKAQQYVRRSPHAAPVGEEHVARPRRRDADNQRACVKVHDPAVSRRPGRSYAGGFLSTSRSSATELMQ